jgi:hypothetical protein
VARHANPTVVGRRRGLIIIGLVVLIVGGAAAGTITWLQRPSAPTTATLGCTPVSLSIVAAPEIAPIVTSAVGRASQGGCRTYAVRSARSSEVAAEIAHGTTPDVWVPDSSVWLAGLPEAAAGPGAPGGSLATSPIAIAAPASGKGALSAAPSSWADYVNVSGDVAMANPDVDTVSRLAYLASRVGAPTSLTQTVAGRLIVMSRYAVASTDDLFGAALKGTSTTAFPASQQSITAFNASTSATELTAVYPTAGTVSLDYPWTVRPGLDGAKATAAEAALHELTAADTRTALTDAGFAARAGSGTAADAPKELQLPSMAAAQVALTQWDLLRIDMRMLAVIDVSGSMKYPAANTGGLTRAEVTKEASIAALRILPAGSEIGSWIFSTRLGPNNRDWRELVPIARLDSRSGGMTHRELLIKRTAGLPSLLGGDTGLYDTTLAAYLHMRDTYNGDYVNSVVVMTDGKNDDTDGGISLAQLLGKLAAARDAQRPVRIITIGMGEADPAALKKIAAATGGTSYIANTADDLQRVFVQALLARTTSIPTPSP